MVLFMKNYDIRPKASFGMNSRATSQVCCGSYAVMSTRHKFSGLLQKEDNLDGGALISLNYPR